MATIKSYTDISQSKKLAEILSLESADMYWFRDDTETPKIYPKNMMKDSVSVNLPCWSLTALLSILPKIDAEEPMVRKLYYASKPVERYICKYGLINMTSEYDNPIDACYEMIMKLHENNLL